MTERGATMLYMYVCVHTGFYTCIYMYMYMYVSPKLPFWVYQRPCIPKSDQYMGVHAGFYTCICI